MFKKYVVSVALLVCSMVTGYRSGVLLAEALIETLEKFSKE